jgi:DNA-binding NarL/FixJ family response regulator
VDPLARLTERERAVLEQMAQGHTNAAVAAKLHVSQSAVEKHVNAIFDKLDLNRAAGYSRRVLAVLRYLSS